MSRRLLAAPVLAALLLLPGCGTDSASAPTTEAGAGATGPGSTDPVPPVEPTGPTESDDPDPGADGASTIGEVVVDATLGVDALEFAGSTTPPALEVTSADALAAAFPDVPGVDGVVATLAAQPPTDEQRVFVYTVAACNLDDLSLRLRGEELTMVVAGTSTVRCEPPPVHMVVWTVPADELPADVVPGRAVQK